MTDIKTFERARERDSLIDEDDGNDKPFKAEE